VITFDLAELKDRLSTLEQDLGQPGFWDDPQRAASVSSEHARLTRRLERYVIAGWESGAQPVIVLNKIAEGDRIGILFGYPQQNIVWAAPAIDITARTPKINRRRANTRLPGLEIVVIAGLLSNVDSATTIRACCKICNQE